MRDLPVASHAGRAGLGLGGMSGKGTHSALSPEGKGPGEGCSGTGGSTGEAGGRTDRIMSKDQEGGQCGWRSVGRSGRGEVRWTPGAGSLGPRGPAVRCESSPKFRESVRGSPSWAHRIPSVRSD